MDIDVLVKVNGVSQIAFRFDKKDFTKRCQEIPGVSHKLSRYRPGQALGVAGG